MSGLLLLFASVGSLRAQAPGTVDPVFGGASLGLSGNVSVVALQPDGKVLVGGMFASGLVRLDADGSLDAGFHAAIDFQVQTVSLQKDGKILVASPYETVNGNLEILFTRLNADGTADAGFHAGTSDGPVETIVVQSDGKILFSGFFSQINGTDRSSLARLNADGSLDASFSAGTNRDIDAMALQADGKIVIAGGFSQINGVDENGVARLNADGSLDTGFHASAEEVESLAVQADGKIVLFGGSTLVNGVAQPIVRLNADGSVDTGFQTSLDGYFDLVASVVQPDNKIVFFGYYIQDGAEHSNVARLNTDGSFDTSFSARPNDIVSSLVLQPDGKVLLGGAFTQVNGVGTSSVVRLAANGAIDHSFNADTASGSNTPVSSLALQADGKILIGGGFTQVNGVSHPAVARLNTDGSLDTGFNAGISVGGRVLALQPDGKILTDLARLNADGSLDAGFNATVGDVVLALAVQSGGKVVIGGYLNYTEHEEQMTRDALARLNADGSLDTSFLASIGYDGTILELFLQPDGKILVGGSFTQINGVPQPGLARLNGDGSLDASFNAKNDGEVNAVVLQPDGKIIAAGFFNQVNGVSQTLLIRLNADGSLDNSFQASFSSDGVSALALQSDGKIVVGGSFRQVDGVNQNYLARLNADGSLDPFFNAGGSGPNDVVNALLLQPDGKIFVGGAFTSINGTVRNHIARLNGGGSPDFFNGAKSVGGGFYYEQFPNGNVFGYYNMVNYPIMYHVDMGFEYFIDAQDGHGGAYLYDFASNTFLYTSPTFPFPYLYDFSLQAFLYYYPDPNNAGHYNTNGVRYFYDFSTGKIITK